MLSIRRVDLADNRQLATLLPLLQTFCARGHDTATALADLSPPRQPGGIVAICAGRGIVRGLFCYHVTVGPDRRKELAVRNVIIQPLGRTLVARSIVHAVVELAAEARCDGVRIALPPSADWEIAFFAAHGQAILHLASTPDAATIH